MNSIFLYGAPASGKTTLGKRLAFALGRTFIDLDAVIVDHAGKPVPEIFSSEGEEGFRNREREALKRVTESNPGAVIALGGGTLLRPENRELCEAKGTVWCLDTPSAEELERRFWSSPGSRPLGNKASERASHYVTFPRRIADSFVAGESLVIVGSSIAAAVLPHFPVVVDENVAKLYQDLLPDQRRGTESAPYQAQRLFKLPTGERHKTIETVASIWKFCAEAGLGRQDILCACGGGVTGDLTGFAAATWMRGIDWINVPTTLLAMVDASTGGKTGCDLPEGKNLAGAFHSPRLVVIDTDFLKTLPDHRLADGRAEMIKHSIISHREPSDPASHRNPSAPASHRNPSAPARDPLHREPSVLARPTPSEVAAKLKVKVDIVREDPLETKGKRILLNCGHTVGHAVEKASDYRLSHGEAVAIGCVEEARLAVRLGLAKSDWPAELASVFAAAGLPTELPDGMTFESLKPLMRGDKKRAGDTVTFALPCGWGDVRPTPIDLS